MSRFLDGLSSFLPPKTEEGEGPRPDAVIAGQNVFFDQIVRDDHLYLVAPSADGYPYFQDYAGVVPTEDWLTAAVPDDLGLFFTDSSTRLISAVNVASIIGVGNEILYQATTNATIKETGDVTLRCVLLANNLTSGMTFKLVSCQGIGDRTLPENNVLYELEMTEPNRFQVKHESGSNVQHAAEYEIPFDLDPSLVYDVSATREGNAWRPYLNGWQLNDAVTVTGGTVDADGVFTPSSVPENGADALGTYESRTTRIQFVEAIGSALTSTEIRARVISDVDPRILPLTRTNSEILSAFESGNELAFLIADEQSADKVIDVVGDLTGTFASSPARVTPILNGGNWGKGAGNTVGYRSSSNVFEETVGGPDVSLIYRWFGIWGDGDSLAAIRRCFGASVSSGTINTYGYGYFSSNTRFDFLQQFGSKVNGNSSFTLPFALQDGDPFVLTVGQVDAGSSSQDVRVWVNGVPCTVNVAGLINATDNGDGSVNQPDGLVNGTTQYCWLAVNFTATSTFSWGRFFQIDRGTTDTTNEAALATQLLGATGRLVP